jgi:transketolase N-terminal domain/subunit
MWALPAGVLVALAAGTRLSLGVLLPVTALWLLVQYRRTGAAFFWFSLGGAVGLFLVYGPPLLETRESFLFAQRFHVARGGRDLFFAVGSLARTVRAYLPVCLLGGALVVFRVFRAHLGVHPSAADEEPAGIVYRGGVWPSLWICAFLGVFLVQLASPFPYDDYQVPVMGLLVAALAGWGANSTSAGSMRGCLCLFWVLASLAGTVASPLPQEWLVARQDRFWTVRKPVSDLALLRATAPRCPAAGRRGEDAAHAGPLPCGRGRHARAGRLEMGPFCYFPSLDDADAARFRVLNRNRLSALLASAPCRVAAFSGYGLAIRSPVMDEIPQEDVQLFWGLLGKQYDRVRRCRISPALYDARNFETANAHRRRKAVRDPHVRRIASIRSPSDVQALGASQLPELAQEIRSEILETVSRTGGHLASNLGAVELTIALLRAFSPPVDKVVWDVGHQTYAWKLLTGRRDRFSTLRQRGGLSGFPKPEESACDAFVAGHAGTALSVALGLAVGRDRRGGAEHVVAVIGDGSLTNGLSLEALNGLDDTGSKLIVILNDNEMSISENVGALSRRLGRMLADVRYNRIKAAAEKAGHRLHMTPLRSIYHRLEQAIKSLWLQNAFFEAFGIRYVGPIDGHDSWRWRTRCTPPARTSGRC